MAKDDTLHWLAGAVRVLLKKVEVLEKNAANAKCTPSSSLAFCWNPDALPFVPSVDVCLAALFPQMSEPCGFNEEQHAVAEKERECESIERMFVEKMGEVAKMRDQCKEKEGECAVDMDRGAEVPGDCRANESEEVEKEHSEGRETDGVCVAKEDEVDAGERTAVQMEISRYTSDPDDVKRVLEIISLLKESERDRAAVEEFTFMCGRAIVQQLQEVLPGCSAEAALVCVAGKLMEEECYWVRDGPPRNMREAAPTILRLLRNAIDSLNDRFPEKEVDDCSENG